MFGANEIKEAVPSYMRFSYHLDCQKRMGGINQFTFLTVCPIQGHLEAGAYPNHHSVRAGIKSGQPHIFTSVLNPLQHHLLQFPHSHSHGGYF